MSSVTATTCRVVKSHTTYDGVTKYQQGDWGTYTLRHTACKLLVVILIYFVVIVESWRSETTSTVHYSTILRDRRATPKQEITPLSAFSPMVGAL